MKFKGFKSKMIIIVVMFAMILSSVFVFAGCGGNYDFRIGINQFIQHPSLDQTREGFVERLTELMAEEGKTVRFDYQNANGIAATNATINTNFIARNVDMIFAIATPSATNARDAAAPRGTPVVYGAITAPEAPHVGLSGYSHVAGVSDYLDMKVQLEFIGQVLGGSVSNIAFIYSGDEGNSEIQRDSLLAAAQELDGVTVVPHTINAVEDIAPIMALIANSNAQVIYIGTDNRLAANMQQIANLNSLATNSLPVITGATSMAEEGGVASLGVDYTDVGRYSAEIAFRILIGEETPGDIEPFYFDYDTLSVLINKRVAANIGFEIPQALIERADIIIIDDESRDCGCGNGSILVGMFVILAVMGGALLLAKRKE
ncbi:MAG: ABC transporter substrate-binding protein [Firmicutes bacterium]|nr:ABC transporter substrate-binding protein [Bacillota bacterium]